MKKNPTLLKTISWLAISYVLIASTAWYESGSLSVGLLAAFWASLIKTPIYSLHESLWGKLIFKNKPQEHHHNVITFQCQRNATNIVLSAEASPTSPQGNEASGPSTGRETEATASHLASHLRYDLAIRQVMYPDGCEDHQPEGTKPCQL